MTMYHHQDVAIRSEVIALVTGTSSGFGMLTAIELAKRDYLVIATMRDPQGASELLERAAQAGVSQQLIVTKLDVTDHAAITSVIVEILASYHRIDVLVNNAGLAVGGFIEDVSMEQWRQQMETNFFGLVALTQAVLPVMRKQQSGIIFNISSISGRVGFPGYAPYASSKFAVEGFSESLRHELAPLGIKVVLIEPGAYRTPIWKKGLAQMSPSTTAAYQARLEAITSYSRRTSENAPDPQQVADLIGKLVGRRSLKLRYPLGSGSRLALWGKAILPWVWFERIVERATR